MRSAPREIDEEDSVQIFAEAVSVHIKPHGRDEFVAQLTVCLRPDNPAHPRNLLLELTDENDLLFYHSLMLGEGDYHSLRAEQRLLVDFQSFPEQLAVFLRRCCGTEVQGLPSLSSGSKMLAVLDCGPAGVSNFSIVESNHFRELTHIALQLRQGSDEVVKKHLAQKLRAARAEAASLGQRLATTSEALMQSQKQVNELTASARVVADERVRLEESLRTTHQRELRESKEEHVRAIAELQRSLTEERAQLESEHKQELRAALDRAQSAEGSVEELQRTRQSLAATGQGCRERLEVAERQVMEASQETSELRKQLKQLEELKFRHERDLSGLQVQLASVKEQLAVREQHASSQAAQIDEAVRERRMLEESLATVKKQAQSLEEKFNLSAQEIAKGNRIIQNLHQTSKEAKAKLRLKASELMQHEKTRLELEKAEELKKHALEEKGHELSRGKAREEKLQQDIEDLKRKLAEAHDVMKSNREVIEYLNRQLTERDLKALPGPASPWSTSDPTSAATLRVPGANSALSELLGKVDGLTATKKSPAPSIGFGTATTGLGMLSGLSMSAFSTPSPAKTSVLSATTSPSPPVSYSPNNQDEDASLRKPVVYKRPGTGSLEPTLRAAAV
ncbi:SASS6 [Symbiodinium natans]|uniref:SASS6 protein n=1 Tax=Symbiodinium natans TaxID=878477 RepID=A0A812Q9W4_9DINO|nr:SASS6 [Symbiodinium natans]